MQLVKVTLIPVAQMNEQKRHTHEVQIDNDHLNLIDEIVCENNGDIDNFDLSRALGDAIMPDMINFEDVDVPNSWSGERYRVIMEWVIDEIGAYGDGQRVVACGYTDRMDISSANEIADDTNIYLNSIITIRDTERQDASGRTRINSLVTSNNQLIHGRYEPRFHNVDYVARPQDVFTMLSNIHDLGETDDEEDGSDSRVMFAAGAKQSRRTNNMGGRYMAKLISADRSGYAESLAYNDEAFSATRNSQANRMAADARIRANAVLSKLYNETSLGDGRTIEYQDLATFTSDDTIESLDDITFVGTREYEDFDYHANGMDDALEETMIAVIVANAVPAILADFVMASIKFTCGNEDSVNGQFEADIIDSTTYVSGLANDETLEHGFIKRFEQDVYDVVSNNNGKTVLLNIQSEVAGVTRVKVAVGSQPWEEYVIASFADSNLVPVITERYANLKNIATGYASVRQAVDAMCDRPEDDSDLESSSSRLPRNNSRGILDIDLDL